MMKYLILLLLLFIPVTAQAARTTVRITITKVSFVEVKEDGVCLIHTSSGRVYPCAEQEEDIGNGVEE